MHTSLFFKKSLTNHDARAMILTSFYANKNETKKSRKYLNNSTTHPPNLLDGKLAAARIQEILYVFAFAKNHISTFLSYMHL